MTTDINLIISARIGQQFSGDCVYSRGIGSEIYVVSDLVSVLTCLLSWDSDERHVGLNDDLWGGNDSWYLLVDDELLKLVDGALLFVCYFVRRKDLSCVWNLTLLDIWDLDIDRVWHSIVNSNWELLLYMEGLLLVLCHFNLLRDNIWYLLEDSVINPSGDFKVDWELFFNWNFIDDSVWNLFGNNFWDFMSNSIWNLNFRDNWLLYFLLNWDLLLNSVRNLFINSVSFKFRCFVLFNFVRSDCNLIWDLLGLNNRHLLCNLVFFLHVVSYCVNYFIIRRICSHVTISIFIFSLSPIMSKTRCVRIK